ncbi:hypothetical protein KL935_004236 [Ogataea polymorpha]|nr:uncharacterized protein OGAPODRAFT_9482 [Ogataea polymorpha]KAG7878282.1 hypothetical protein KL937_004024 [Ogataea polymorpha]KAG7898637.1 hypothetical protein KL935_004236 [Ogataea polymorpha]KAG7914752.1 hypothetical protein KL927_004421 [Ogataea polymorpha]KAG7931171.1 hypothetical protein KL934_004292 [Ogataea polymorpha]KAG7933150.1 hypothetical protein KL904_004206 [Ogataea polymorpha]
MSKLLQTEIQQKLSQANMRIADWLGGESSGSPERSAFEDLPVIKPGAGLDLSSDAARIGDFTSGKVVKKAKNPQRPQSRSLQALQNKLRNANRDKARAKVEKTRREATRPAPGEDGRSEDDSDSDEVVRRKRSGTTTKKVSKRPF